MKIYRYLTNDEGVWSAGKRLLPAELVEKANRNRAWLIKPQLAEGNYRFWLTGKGKNKYELTLYKTHQKYLPNITLEERDCSELVNIAYEDEFQVVEEIE